MASFEVVGSDVYANANADACEGVTLCFVSVHFWISEFDLEPQPLLILIAALYHSVGFHLGKGLVSVHSLFS